MKPRALVLLSSLVAGAIVAGLGSASAAPVSCAAVRAPNWRPSIGVADDAGDVRVFAIQFKQDLRHIETYEAFEHKMDCLVQEFVVPHLDDKPTIVVFNEDNGLAQLGTGTRGIGARAITAGPVKDPDSIAGAQGAFATLGATYSPGVAYYAAQEPETSPQRLILAAATDVFARGFMTTFSEMARRYGVYVVSSNNQAEFRVTRVSEHPEALALVDPDLAAEYLAGSLDIVYEAVDDDTIPETQGAGRAGIDVHNQAFMWAPVDGVTDYAAARYEPLNGAPLTADDPRANLIHVVKKTPLTDIEREVLDLSDDHDLSPANTGPFCLLAADDPSCAAKMGYGISLPTFMFGETECAECPGGMRDLEFGEAPTTSADPCTLGPKWWMRCLDHRGVNLLLQPEANPGPWGGFTTGRESRGSGLWQPLTWLDSAWRAVADPTVGFRYAVTPHMVGNLVDLVFDGQSVIFERCAETDAGDTCAGNEPQHFIGTGSFVACESSGDTGCEPEAWLPYAGPQRQIMVLAPWVLEEDPSLSVRENRQRFERRAQQMLAGSGSVFENDYLETTVWADLDLW